MTEPDWTKILYVENPQLVLPVLLERKKRSEYEVSGLGKIFHTFKIPPGSKILDLSCGIGSHAIRLVQKGHEVVGYDPSTFFIKKALSYAKKEMVDLDKLRFYDGTIEEASRLLMDKGEKNFDVVICMYNSFGYFKKENDINMLKDIKTLASKECLLVLEIENRDWRLKNFHPLTYEKYGDLEIFEKWNFNQESSESHCRSRFYRKKSEKHMHLILDLRSGLRLYSLHELIEILNTSGWKYIKSYGDIETLSPQSIDSEWMVTISLNNHPKVHL